MSLILLILRYYDSSEFKRESVLDKIMILVQLVLKTLPFSFHILFLTFLPLPTQCQSPAPQPAYGSAS